MEQIFEVPFQDQLKEQYIEYAKDVIKSRAIPDIKDGLKPVHRRIVATMYELGLTPKSSFKKSAQTVGAVLGWVHPHGDSSVYDAMVGLAQPFNMRYPLVLGAGNFGSTDGDPAAAMRYTEAKLSPYGELMMQYIEKNTVDMIPNYDNSRTEPEVLPGLFPYLLANGAMGIAVGMASSFAPHRAYDIYQALVYMLDKEIKKEEIKIDDLINIVQAPDFPTGGVIVNPSEVREAYVKGEGRVILQGKYHIEQGKRNSAIVFTELPYKVIKTKLVSKIAELSKETIPDIQEVRDESDREGTRVVIEIRRNANTDWILKNLFKHTQLQTSISLKHVALVDGKPQLNLNLYQLLDGFLSHAKQVIRRKVTYDLAKALKRMEIVSGIQIVLSNLDEALTLIRSTKTYKETVEKLMEVFDLSNAQATAIADMKLWTLNEDGVQKYTDEYEELSKNVNFWNGILEDKVEWYKEVRRELASISKIFEKDTRRTEIGKDLDNNEDQRFFIKEEDIVIMLTHEGIIKAVKAEDYSTQKKAGKGSLLKTEDGNTVTQIYTANTRDDLIIATNQGRILLLPMYKVPLVSKTSVGKYLTSFVPLKEDETIIKVMPVSKQDEERHLMLTTTSGYGKRMQIKDLPKISAGAKCINFRFENEQLFDCAFVEKDDHVIVVTRYGNGVRFASSEVSIQGRAGGGVRLLKFKEENESIVSVLIVKDEDEIIIVQSNGKGKSLPVSAIKSKHRGGKVSSFAKINSNKDYVSSAVVNKEDYTLFIVTTQGRIIRILTSDLPNLGKSAAGNKIVKLDKDDTVATITIGPKEEKE